MSPAEPWTEATDVVPPIPHINWADDAAPAAPTTPFTATDDWPNPQVCNRHGFKKNYFKRLKH